MGNKYINRCHCGQRGDEDYQKIIGGKRIWAHLRFCSEEHKEIYERMGNQYAALNPRHLKNVLKGSGLEESTKEQSKYKKSNSE
jgi:hypothetical protein